MELNLPGLEEARKECKEINDRKKSYAIINMSFSGTITLTVAETGGEDKAKNPTGVVKLDEIKNTFDECARQTIEKDVPLVILYNFIFFDRDGVAHYKMVLISYKPRELGAKENVVFSTVSLQIMNELHIPCHVAVHSKDDLTYDWVAQKVGGLKLR